MSTPHNRPAIVLIGPPGAGKSTIGRAIARRTQHKYLDLDQVIEANTGRAVTEIFATSGEAYFRELESEALSHALGRDGLVLALGGGTPVSETNQQKLGEYAASGGTIVFLDVSVDAAVARLGESNTDRPLLAGDTRGKLTALLDERRAIYESVSTLHLDTSTLHVNQIAQQLVDHITPTK